MIVETLKEDLENKVEKIPQRVKRKRDRTWEIGKIEKYQGVSPGDPAFECQVFQKKKAEKMKKRNSQK